LVCGNEITPRRVVVGLELSEGIISKTEIWDINLQKYFIEMDEKN